MVGKRTTKPCTNFKKEISNLTNAISDSSGSSSSTSGDEILNDSAPNKKPYVGDCQMILKGESYYHSPQMCFIKQNTLSTAKDLTSKDEERHHFRDVFGLKRILNSLTENIIFPLKFNLKIEPTKGILFFGESGTGKSFVSHCFYNECIEQKIPLTFFEIRFIRYSSVKNPVKEICHLFAMAAIEKPSVIFLNGLQYLLPDMKSCHSTVQEELSSALVGLLDSVKDDKMVMIIGEIDRLSNLRTSLKSRGNFARSYFFPLPNFNARIDILKKYFSDAGITMPPNFLDEISENMVNFNCSDLKEFGNEVLKKYWNHQKRSKLEPNYVELDKGYFKIALNGMKKTKLNTVSIQNIFTKPLPSNIKALLGDSLEKSVASIKNIFPFFHERYASPQFNETFSQSENAWPPVYHPRFLICGEPDQGHTVYLAPAILHCLEHLPRFCFTIVDERRLGNFYMLVDEACSCAPSVIYIPNIEALWLNLNAEERIHFISYLGIIDPHLSVFILCTSNNKFKELDGDLQCLFNKREDQIFAMQNPTSIERMSFFKPLFEIEMLRMPINTPNEECDSTLLLAENEDQFNFYAHDEKEEFLKKFQRNLRVYLRFIMERLKDSNIYETFSDPVDLAICYDYNNIIANPIDLRIISERINSNAYQTLNQFLKDIQLIRDNALKYNPRTNPVDRQIRADGIELVDMIEFWLDHEVDKEFKDISNQIMESNLHNEVKKASHKKTNKGIKNLKRKREDCSLRIIVPTYDNTNDDDLNVDGPLVSNFSNHCNFSLIVKPSQQSLNIKGEKDRLNPFKQNKYFETRKKVSIDTEQSKRTFRLLIEMTVDWNIKDLEKIENVIQIMIFKNRNSMNKNEILKSLNDMFIKYQRKY